MKLHKHFLKEDLYNADKEFNCFKDCLILAYESVEKGDMQAAQLRMYDANRSFTELARLSKNKNESEQLGGLINRMYQSGVDFQVMRRAFRD